MKVAIIGGGASGTAAALTLLELHECKYSAAAKDNSNRGGDEGGTNENLEIVMFEKESGLGGMATSVWSKNEEQIYNNGVQGTHKAFVLTTKMVENNTSLKLTKTALTARFIHSGVAKQWSNLEGNATFKNDVAKFTRLCRYAQKHQMVFALVTIVTACKMMFISKEFIDQAVVPTLALFFGTGNQAANVPATLGCSVFEVPGGKSPITIFTIDSERFISVADDVMLAFPPLTDVYSKIREKLQSNTNCEVICNSYVESIEISNNKQNASIRYKVNNNNNNDDVQKSVISCIEFDKIICATQAEDALRILPSKHKARGPLKWATYYTDITVSHRDKAHMVQHFQMDQDVTYYMHNRSNFDMDMGFLLNRYQKHLNDTKSESSPPQDMYQTLYLDIEKSSPNEKHDMSKTKEIDPDLVDRIDTWRQVGHTTGHLIGCVARMRSVHGPIVFFAGSYLLVNSHEIAIMTGIRAAQRVLNQHKTEFPSQTFGEPGIGWDEFVKALG